MLARLRGWTTLTTLHPQFFNKIESKIDNAGGGKPAATAGGPPPDLSSPPSRRQLYRYREQAGVNLGSWFSLEGWLSPSLFDQNGTPKGSEMDLVEKLGADKATEVLERHWDSWMNDGDWQVRGRASYETSAYATS